MGVSLERVQFKFASIVGELCNDPDILSQFAVWLDLRLAEYKLKGAISLDCSGEEPDADWMNGLKKCKKCGSQQHHHGTSPQRARQHSNSSQKYSYQQSTSNPEIYPWDSGNSRLSPEVKSENQEVHVVPMELHMNSIRTNSLKRPRNADSWSHSRESPSKRPFMSSSNPSSDNQSLLSVIGGDVDSTNQQENDDDVIQVIEADTLQTSQQSHGDSRAGNSPAETSMNNDQFLLESSQNSNTDSTSRQGTTQEDPNNIWVNQQGTSPTKGVSIDEIFNTQGLRRTKNNRERRQKISTERLAVIPRQTVTSMVAAVGTFERWLWERADNDRRSITDIPATELDDLLAEFYETIVTPSGANYTPKSFSMLRCCLSRFLKEANYPHAIQTSRLFLKSPVAYRKRQRALSNAKTISHPMNSRYELGNTDEYGKFGRSAEEVL